MKYTHIVFQENKMFPITQEQFDSMRITAELMGNKVAPINFNLIASIKDLTDRVVIIDDLKQKEQLEIILKLCTES